MTKYSYQSLGDPKAKDTIIFLHGWGGSAKSFEQLSEKILKQASSHKPQASLRLILLDLPGFGNATSPPKDGWTTHDYGYWFEEFIATEFPSYKSSSPPGKGESEGVNSPHLHLYGHSFGCRVIIRYLLRNTEFKGKVFLTGAAGLKWPPNTKTSCTKFLSKTITPIKKVLPGKLKKKLLRRLGAGDWADMKPALKHTFQKVLKEEDLRIHLAKIYQQVYLLWGKQDKYTPFKSAEVFHRALPHSRLKVFEEGRHGIHYTHTDQIAKIITKFISQKV